MRIEVPFDRNTAYLSDFSRGRNITFVQNGSIKVNGRRTFCLIRKKSISDAGVCGTLYPKRLEIPINRNAAYLSRFPSVTHINFLQSNNFEVKGRNTVSHIRKPLM
jgi:hypothetical protein